MGVALASPADCQVTGVHAAFVHTVWDAVAELLEPAVERSNGRMNMATLRRSIEARDKQLWLAHVDGDVIAAWVTQVNEYPDVRVCEMLFGGGRLGEIQMWLDLGLNSVEGSARDKGCGLIELVGRPGWRRELERRGYRHSHVVMEKSVEALDG